MDEHREMIWQRGSGKKIVQEARKRFRETVKSDPVSAYVAFASVHYSLVKRYTCHWWKKPLAAWHLWRADVCVVDVMEQYNCASMKASYIDIITKIHSQTPFWFGGDINEAKQLAEFGLSEKCLEAKTMKPHTRALILITLGDIEYRLGNTDRAWEHYNSARMLVPAIETEDSPDRERQLVRVLKSVGFFYRDHAGGNLYATGMELITQALELANRVSKDQEEKILAELRKRGLG